MKIYIITILSFVQILSAIENNPFSLKKNFQNIDKAEYNLFSTLQEELKAADMVLSIPTVKFKDLQIDVPLDRAMDITKNLQSDIEETSLFTSIDNFLRKQQEEYSSFFNTFDLETYINTNFKISQVKNEKKKIKKKKIQTKDIWEMNIANIDLKKEERKKKRHLQQLYKQAVKDVDNLRY